MVATIVTFVIGVIVRIGRIGIDRIHESLKGRRFLNALRFLNVLAGGWRYLDTGGPFVVGTLTLPTTAFPQLAGG